MKCIVKEIIGDKINMFGNDIEYNYGRFILRMKEIIELETKLVF